MWNLVDFKDVDVDVEMLLAFLALCSVSRMVPGPRLRYRILETVLCLSGYLLSTVWVVGRCVCVCV